LADFKVTTEHDDHYDEKKCNSDQRTCYQNTNARDYIRLKPKNSVRVGRDLQNWHTVGAIMRSLYSSSMPGVARRDGLNKPEILLRRFDCQKGSAHALPLGHEHAGREGPP